MNREERAAIWRDEVAHPQSPATWAAMQASGANMTLVDEWRDLEGDNDGDWMTYDQFIEGAIGIAADYGYDEVDPPDTWSRFHGHLKELWDELAKITHEGYDENGSSRTERIRYALSRQQSDEEYILKLCPHKRGDRARAAIDMTASELRALASVRDRQEIVRRVHAREAEDAKANVPSALTESIIDLPGELYVRYNPETKTFLGFGFTPINDAHPGFTHVDGPEPGCDLTDYDNPVWNGMREYLSNVQQISGEAAFAVQWTEDGWRVK